jgi:hypothetical protein
MTPIGAEMSQDLRPNRPKCEKRPDPALEWAAFCLEKDSAPGPVKARRCPLSELTPYLQLLALQPLPLVRPVLHVVRHLSLLFFRALSMLTRNRARLSVLRDAVIKSLKIVVRLLFEMSHCF